NLCLGRTVSQASLPPLSRPQHPKAPPHGPLAPLPHVAPVCRQIVRGSPAAAAVTLPSPAAAGDSDHRQVIGVDRVGAHGPHLTCIPRSYPLSLVASGAITRRQLGSIYQQSNAAALLAHDAQLLPLWMEPINDANHGGHRHEEIRPIWLALLPRPAHHFFPLLWGFWSGAFH